MVRQYSPALLQRLPSGLSADQLMLQAFPKLIHDTFLDNHPPQRVQTTVLSAGAYLLQLHTAYLLSSDPSPEETQGHQWFLRKNEWLTASLLEQITRKKYQAGLIMDDKINGKILIKPI